ncbi:MAG: tryptophan-rich sensory protein [Clostridiaceae bacterium]|nr:tryptophan-rich sensory protein [Clostridiaceae bacterium]
MGNVFKVDGKFKIKALIISILVTVGVGFLSWFTARAYFKDYLKLNKPIFSPPSFVFPVVWIALYILMAIAVYIVYLKKYSGINNAKAIKLYALQLFLNFLWPVLFFNLRLYALSFLELMILLVYILLTTFEFLKKDMVAAFLMLPYILWVSFAGVLNYTIWMMN